MIIFIAEIVVINSLSIHILILVLQTLEESLIIEIARPSPSLLRQGEKTGEDHVIDSLGGNHSL